MKVAADLRAHLRETTRDVHERMHTHPGFSAAASGKIAMSSYRDLLARLYGFHRAFERDFDKAPAEMASSIALRSRARSSALALDLAELGLAESPAALPLCETVPRLETEPQWLGALYVLEGSTLGGATIARALQVAGFSGRQRHFFEAYGDRRGEMWRLFIARLETHAGDIDAAASAENTARSVFDAFEQWMANWRDAAFAGAARSARPPLSEELMDV